MADAYTDCPCEEMDAEDPSDRFYIKKFEDETNLRCHLLLDQSRSMTFGSLDWTKADYAHTLRVRPPPRVTDAGVRVLLGLKGLRKLWLHDLPITDESIVTLTQMKNLRELHIYATKISAEGARRLQSVLTECKVIHESIPN